MHITARNTRVLQQPSLLANNAISTHISIHFHTNAISEMSCDVINHNQAELHMPICISNANI